MMPMTPQAAPPQAAQPEPAVLHDVTYKRTKAKGRVCIENVPPEEFLISRRAKSVADSPYVAHRVRKTLSDLIAEGYDRDQVMDLSGDDSILLQGEAVTRDANDNSTPQELNDREGVMREVWVTESYIRVDFDGDGIAEMRKVVTAGTGYEVLKKDGKPDNEEWEGPAPFQTIAPVIQPHKWAGVSIADMVGDLQVIKSVLWRQMLNNLYLTNEPGKIVSEQVNLDDLLDRRIGRIVRLKNGAKPGDGHVQDEAVPFMAGSSFQMLEYIDTVRENRTGVTRYNQGLDANSLNKTATGINAITQAAQQRIELIARIFAETGVKDIFRQILRLVTKYQSDKRVIRLRNEWVPMDPNEWDSEFDVVVSVGLGTGNKDQMAQHLMSLLNIQMQAIQMQGGIQGPLVTGENVYNSTEKLIENMGLKSPERYITDPAKAPPQQPQPDPEMMKAQQEMQLRQQEMQGNMQLNKQKVDGELQIQQAKAAGELQLQHQKLQAESTLKQAQTAGDMQMKQSQFEAQNGADGLLRAIQQIVQQAEAKIEAVAKEVLQAAPEEAKPDAIQQIGQMHHEMLQQIAQLAQTLAAPREIIRGADGRATGTRIAQ